MQSFHGEIDRCNQSVNDSSPPLGDDHKFESPLKTILYMALDNYKKDANNLLAKNIPFNHTMWPIKKTFQALSTALGSRSVAIEEGRYLNRIKLASACEYRISTYDDHDWALFKYILDECAYVHPDSFLNADYNLRFYLLDALDIFIIEINACLNPNEADRQDRVKQHHAEECVRRIESGTGIKNSWLSQLTAHVLHLTEEFEDRVNRERVLKLTTHTTAAAMTIASSAAAALDDIKLHTGIDLNTDAAKAAEAPMVSEFSAFIKR